MSDVKYCSDCDTEKNLDKFWTNNSRTDGLCRYCKDCTRIRQRRYKLRRKYGITEEEYLIMLKQQNYSCAICGDRCVTERKLAVDHCHDTGLVRGLLCHPCNTSIGKFQHSPNLLRAAADYLEEENHAS